MAFFRAWPRFPKAQSSPGPTIAGGWPGPPYTNEGNLPFVFMRQRWSFFFKLGFSRRCNNAAIALLLCQPYFGGKNFNPFGPLNPIPPAAISFC